MISGSPKCNGTLINPLPPNGKEEPGSGLGKCRLFRRCAGVKCCGAPEPSGMPCAKACTSPRGHRPRMEANAAWSAPPVQTVSETPHPSCEGEGPAPEDQSPICGEEGLPGGKPGEHTRNVSKPRGAWQPPIRPQGGTIHLEVSTKILWSFTPKEILQTAT